MPTENLQISCMWVKHKGRSDNDGAAEALSDGKQGQETHKEGQREWNASELICTLGHKAFWNEPHFSSNKLKKQHFDSTVTLPHCSDRLVLQHPSVAESPKIHRGTTCCTFKFLGNRSKASVDAAMQRDGTAGPSGGRMQICQMLLGRKCWLS